MVTIPDKPVIHNLNPDWFGASVQAIDMLRLDMLHPVISGNKWFKLKYNLSFAVDNGYSSVLTFGGGYSNHLAATVAAANAYGIKSVGVIRGRYPQLTPTLRFCIDNGMQLYHVSHDEYNRKEDITWLNELSNQFKKPYIIPEGGANEQGRIGAGEIASFIQESYTYICMPVGTGTTMAGICNAVAAHQTVYGYAPMKGGKYLANNIAGHISKSNPIVWDLFDDWHFGGFGKANEELVTFMNEFYTINTIPLDMVYTAKMMYGLGRQLHEWLFPANARILCIHTGGLQGNSSLAGKLLY